MPKFRCVNIDWLEVCCHEPTNSRDGLDNKYARNAEYFESNGYRVEQRAYGTPMYREMFTVFNGKTPLVEVRRSPYSARSSGGIFPDNICHLRLPNSALYRAHPIEFLAAFIKTHRFEYRTTTRIDFCCDFNTFDNNRDVAKFIRAYMAEKFFKMNQKYVHSHGVDTWPFRDYWSLKWGEETSPITTKLYDKTRELSDGNNAKPYIIDAWRDAGLDTTLPVYRVEFSIKGSQLKSMVQKSTGNLLQLHFYEFPGRDQILFTFMALADRYFDFRKATYTREGNWQRRDRCPKVNLFIPSNDERGYTPIRFVEKPDPTRVDKMLVKRLFAIMEDDAHYTNTEREMAQQVAACIMEAANYKRKGIEMPDVNLRLEREMQRPQMTPAQFENFMAEMRRHWKRWEDFRIRQLANTIDPAAIGLPF